MNGRTRIELGDEFPGQWIELWDDPPMGVWLDIREVAQAALANPGDLALIERAIGAFGPLIAEHHLTDRAGRPIELALRELTSRQFASLLGHIVRAVTGEGAPVPFEKRGRSRARSSPATRRRGATSSGVSRAG